MSKISSENDVKVSFQAKSICYNYDMESPSPRFGTVSHLLELAAQGERFFESFYQRVAARFSHHPEIEKFWMDYAAEENEHARWVEDLRQRVPVEILNSPADPQVLADAEHSLSVPMDNLLHSIRTLQDAFEVANELEHSETNQVIEFLISHFSEDEQARAFLRTQLHEHIERLMIQFPRQYGTGSLRRGINALDS